ncbi:hypothetical protein QMK33_18390 [Hymenobacter sp. H14-R3]|uniref:hypothetical protein n=1 Tax=Hymenobacter sp. H14-R3 TaxID=3046308 RepID=UPI0024BA7BD7|nr:hypothetical protein [Hymenobacter sp. H14-R3]MDJ0367124.1 hypothetical protein [Hymenobacter sp. H14-R3]
MKKIFIPILLPQALLAALVLLVGMYGIGYSWIEDGACSSIHASLLSIVPGLVALLVTVVVGSHAYCQAAATEPAIPKKYVLVALAALTIGLAFSLDYCFFTLADSSLPEAYASGMRAMLSGSTMVVPDAELLQFAKTPFFSQNLGINCISVVLGYIIALPVAQALLKRPQFA